MAKHVSWSDIESFHNARRRFQKYPEQLGSNPVVTYRAKTKLHGTNAGIIIERDGTVTAMSRTAIITPENDNAGFARWVADNAEAFAKLAQPDNTMVIFGEWCGPGVQKGVAINQIPERIFAGFAIRTFRDSSPAFPVIVDFSDSPENIAAMLNGIPRAYTIPWFNSSETFTVDWTAPAEDLEPVLARINAHVAHVEACDPFCAKEFGIKGIGEGLVFYPTDTKFNDRFSNFAFKSKGEKHQVVAHTKPAQADASSAVDTKAFAELVCAPARLEQGARAVTSGELDFSPQHIPTFLKWMHEDVKKECAAELEASGLDEKLAFKAAMAHARNWYLEQLKKL